MEPLRAAEQRIGPRLAEPGFPGHPSGHEWIVGGRGHAAAPRRRPVGSRDTLASAPNHVRKIHMSSSYELIGDAEREAVITELHAAFVAGRLIADELNLRLEQAMVSRTQTDLDAVMVGLRPAHAVAPMKPKKLTGKLLMVAAGAAVLVGGGTLARIQSSEDRPSSESVSAPVSVKEGKAPRSEGGTTSEDGSVTSAETDQPPPAQEAKPSAAAVGGAITLQGSDPGLQVAVTLTKIVENAKPKNDFSKPETGDRFFAVQLILNNTGQVAYSDSPTNGAYLIDAEGQQYSSTYGEVREGVSFGVPVHDGGR